MPLLDTLQAPESGERISWRDPSRTLWSEIRMRRALALSSTWSTIPMIERACVGSTKAGKADA